MFELLRERERGVLGDVVGRTREAAQVRGLVVQKHGKICFGKEEQGNKQGESGYDECNPVHPPPI